MLRLYFCGENSSGRIDELCDGKITVGRGQGNALRITDDSVSRVHSELFVWGSEVIVRDVGSRNGTRVGHKALYNGQCGVKVGEVLWFGSVQARLELSSEVGAECAFDDALEDNTAVHHYSRFMRSNLGAKGDLAAQRAAGEQVAMSVATNSVTRADSQTMFVRRSVTDPLEACAAVMSKDTNASAKSPRDPRRIAARLIDRINSSRQALMEFLAVRCDDVFGKAVGVGAQTSQPVLPRHLAPISGILASDLSNPGDC